MAAQSTTAPMSSRSGTRWSCGGAPGLWRRHSWRGSWLRAVMFRAAPALLALEALLEPAAPALLAVETATEPADPAPLAVEAVTEPAAPALLAVEAVTKPAAPALLAVWAVTEPADPALLEIVAVTEPASPALLAVEPVAEPAAPAPLAVEAVAEPSLSPYENNHQRLQPPQPLPLLSPGPRRSRGSACFPTYLPFPEAFVGRDVEDLLNDDPAMTQRRHCTVL